MRALKEYNKDNSKENLDLLISIAGRLNELLKTYTDTKLAALVDSAPSTLDTLNEFYKPFEDRVEYAYKNMTGATAVYIDEVCPTCKGEGKVRFNNK